MSQPISSKAIYTIPAGLSFVDVLAAGLLNWPDLSLADTTIYLPTRRGARALRDAFLRQSEGKALLLPRMQPLGDLEGDEVDFFDHPELLSLPPAISPLRRRLLLTPLVRQAQPDLGWAQAAELAGDLMQFLDQLQIYGRSLSDIKDLVDVGELAGHWQRVVTFLEILAEPWQSILEAEGVLEPIQRRNKLIDILINRWQQDPIATPVIAAGSTASLPPTARMLAAITELPQGKVVLPGLDLELDDNSWNEIRDTHPQFTMRTFLSRVGVDRSQIQIWPGCDGFDTALQKARRTLASETMRPASTTNLWQQQDRVEESAASGMTLLDAANPHVEATAISILMRQVIETPSETAALVTPDRSLARRVANELQRWGIDIDDSAGQSLRLSPTGTFLRLLAEAAVSGFAPINLLALLKHPYCRLGLPVRDIKRLVRLLDRLILRGPRPAPGLLGIRHEIDIRSTAVPESYKEPLPTEQKEDLLGFIDRIETAVDPLQNLLDQEEASFRDLILAHIAVAENIAIDHDGDLLLWQGDAGEIAANYIAQLLSAADGVLTLPLMGYPALFDILMGEQVVRPRFGRHPRLAIWGPLEARLQQADHLILGSLNEGTWPAEVSADPWLNRPMQKALEIAVPEIRVGLAAHDFAQALAAPRLVLTRSEKVEGNPTVPARWLLRLKQVAAISGLRFETSSADRIHSWAQRLDIPQTFTNLSPPQPKPPVAARPTSLSVSRIEEWLRDPYALYAKRILRLSPLNDIDADPDAASRGTAIHKALDTYIKKHSDLPPEIGRPILLAIGETAFADFMSRPALKAFWWPRFQRLVDWFLAHHWQQTSRIADTESEIKGKLELFIKPEIGQPFSFMLTALADRIDISKDGQAIIIDYKTGQVPRAPQVISGLAPQLTLEAAIARAGGFEDLEALTIDSLEYWHLSGGATAGKIIAVSKDMEELVDKTLAGLVFLVGAFADPNVPYRALPRPEVALQYNDYEHLARLKEWSLNLERRGDP